VAEQSQGKFVEYKKNLVKTKILLRLPTKKKSVRVTSKTPLRSTPTNTGRVQPLDTAKTSLRTEQYR
jgi:hypothetical protein